MEFIPTAENRWKFMRVKVEGETTKEEGKVTSVQIRPPTEAEIQKATEL